MADVSIADLNKTLKDENTKKLKADREEAAKQRSKLDQAGKILGDMAATYFVSVAAIVMGFFGANAYSDKKKK